MLATAGLGVVTALLVLAQALLIARTLAPVLAPAPLHEDGLGWWGWLVPESARTLSTGLAALVGIVTARVAVVWLQERLAHRAGVTVINQLREQVVEHTTTMGPRWVASGEGASVATIVTRGLDGLLPYFVRYLPQLMLAATVTPLMVVVVLGMDVLSAIIVILTLPLIPLFMVLIGLVTRDRSAKHLAAMERLGTRTLDLIQGVPTLRGLGRERGPGARVRELGDAQRRATMGSLRIAFLSGMVLELLTTLSVAIVAVTLGFRLVEGAVSIETALAVLVLAPEVYLPLRQVGTHFHASADGMAAADAAFGVLELTPPVQGGDQPARDLRGEDIHVSGLSVSTPDGRRDAPADLTFTAKAGSLTALVGPNGDGKSTALMALAGLLAADSGYIQAGDGPHLADIVADQWTAQCAWVAQRPDLGPQGRTLSLGQRQRLALERAFTSQRPLVLLDEPTAHLDGDARDDIVERIQAAARSGATIVVATHDERLMTGADAVVSVNARSTKDVS
jgi:ATP-binding cassette subfamily C protein CydD